MLCFVVPEDLPSFMKTNFSCWIISIGSDFLRWDYCYKSANVFLVARFSIAFTWNVNGKSVHVTLFFPPFFHVCRMCFAFLRESNLFAFAVYERFSSLFFFPHGIEDKCRKQGTKTIPRKSYKGAFKSTMTWSHAKLKQQGSRCFTWNVNGQADVCRFA